MLDLLIVLLEHMKSIAVTVFLGAAIAVLVALLLPNKYTATTKILPPQQNQSISASLIGQLGPLAALAGPGLRTGDTSALYEAMLKSRTLEDSLIGQFDLLAVYRQKQWQAARKKLESFTEISVSKEGLITISVEDWDPSRAAAIANAYVDQLYKLNQVLAVTEASQRRLFFEQQLQNEKENLADAEVALKQTQERTGLIQLDGQARVIIESVARLRAEMAAKQVQLESMSTFATSDNPEYIRTEQELQALRGQLEKLEHDKNLEEGDVQIATRNVPAAGLEYIRKYRDVKYHEAIFEMLAKQFEVAKIDEAKSAALIQVLDKAIRPERKSGPPRTVIVLLTSAFAFLLSGTWILTREFTRRAEVVSSNTEKFRRMKHLIGWHNT